MKYQVTVASVLLIFFTDTITVSSINLPQPIQNRLPPEVFPSEENSSIPHIQGQLAPKLFPSDEALEQLHTDSINKNTSKSKEATEDEKSTNISTTGKQTKVASEIPDLLNTDYMNITVYEDATDSAINNETEIVQGPNVVHENKTHDEDASKLQQNCTLDENNSTLNIDCTGNATTQNVTTEKNVSVPIASTELTTDPQKLNVATEDTVETTTSNNLTNEQHENVTKSADNSTSTEVVTKNADNSTITEVVTKSADNSTSTEVVTKSADNSTITEVVTKSADNSTSTEVVTKNADNSTSTEGYSTTVVSANNATLAVNATTVTETSVETTSVNISENIIDHKADAPVALAASQQHSDHGHASSGKSSAFLQPTESAAILAGVFVGIALLGYVGLLVWRRILEKRYGNREMLVNEDDFYDTNDLRNFEA
ncbi:hypothetical protein L9F63_019756, partial [Diploptera punctata]